jgi:hypothetical protein
MTRWSGVIERGQLRNRLARQSSIRAEGLMPDQPVADAPQALLEERDCTRSTESRSIGRPIPGRTV